MNIIINLKIELNELIGGWNRNEALELAGPQQGRTAGRSLLRRLALRGQFQQTNLPNLLLDHINNDQGVHWLRNHRSPLLFQPRRVHPLHNHFFHLHLPALQGLSASDGDCRWVQKGKHRIFRISLIRARRHWFNCGTGVHCGLPNWENDCVCNILSAVLFECLRRSQSGVSDHRSVNHPAPLVPERLRAVFEVQHNCERPQLHRLPFRDL